MATILPEPPKPSDPRFIDWLYRLWKRVTSTTSGELGLGTMADQNADSVTITGGTIDGTTIGETTSTIATFKNASLSARILKVIGYGGYSCDVTSEVGGASGNRFNFNVGSSTGQFSVSLGGTEAVRLLQGIVSVGSSTPSTDLASGTGGKFVLAGSGTSSGAYSTVSVYNAATTNGYATGAFHFGTTGATGSTIERLGAALYSINEATIGQYATQGLAVYTRNGSSFVENFRFTSQGDAQVVGGGKLGYGTGSGGTVTQGTSRTTGVTLNKTNGAITLASAAGSATWQSFTLTNSTIAATDTVRVCQKSGTDLYQIHVTAVAAGSCQITYATTGGTTTEQPVFNFAVIKGVTS